MCIYLTIDIFCWFWCCFGDIVCAYYNMYIPPIYRCMAIVFTSFLYSPCDNTEWWMCKKTWNNISYQRIEKHTYSHLAIVIYTFKKSIHTRCFHPAWWYKRINAQFISDAINQIFTQATTKKLTHTHTYTQMYRKNSKAWLPSIQINRARKMSAVG